MEKMYLLMSKPQEKYNWVVLATSDRHFELVDKGYEDIAQGSWKDICLLDKKLDWENRLKYAIWLKRPNGTYWWTDEDALSYLCRFFPKMVDEQEFVDMTFELYMENY